MINEVYKNIYKCDIPLKGNPLKSINCYVVRTDEKNLIIDTGFNTEECKIALMESLNELDIDFNKTDLIVTHRHSDHLGLAYYLNSKGVKVYIGEKDGETMNKMMNGSYYVNFDKYVKMLDMQDCVKELKKDIDYKDNFQDYVKYEFLKEGENVKVSDYNFEVVNIPGHTLGHIGLYEKSKKIFFCGDHILEQITPSITFSGFEQDILGMYMNSLKKVYNYDIDYLFTAHRTQVVDYRKRIKEILQHHDERLDETIMVMKNGNSTVRNVAENMKWNIKHSSFWDFDVMQRGFATLETMAHLEHLVFTDKAKRIDSNGVLHYKLI